MPHACCVLVAAAVLTVLPLVAPAAVAQPFPASGVDLSALDRSADACTDFYQFACGGWRAANPIPPDRSRWGRFDELQEKNLDVLRAVLEKAAANTGSEFRNIGNYYASCMAEAAINQRGVSPLTPRLRAIESLRSLDALPDLLGTLHAVGVTAFFAFGAEAEDKDAGTNVAALGQGGMGLPDRDYYFRIEAKSEGIRQAYVKHVAALLALGGAEADEAAAAATRVMRMETALARGALDAVARRASAQQSLKMTTAQLQQLTPHFSWARYFKAAGAPPFQSINVSAPEFLKQFDQLLASSALDEVRTYLRWQLLHADAPYLSSAFVNEHFNFYSRTLQGIQELRPRWKRCIAYIDSDLGESLGEAFVREAFPPTATADMLAMVHAVKDALERDGNALSWMTAETRARALAKLKAVENQIGYPDRRRDYGQLDIGRADLVGNVERSSAFEFRRQMAKIDKPIDKTEWEMTPTVGAYDEPLENAINFPAGMLQPPFYSAKADAAINYGGAGAVIGHAIDDVRLNRKLLGENTADNGGLRLALVAYLAGPGGAAPTLDGFTPEQRLFLGWGQVWCENRRPEYERLQAYTNPHSPGPDRVNGVVSNMPEFRTAFACRTGQ